MCVYYICVCTIYVCVLYMCVYYICVCIHPEAGLRAMASSSRGNLASSACSIAVRHSFIHTFCFRIFLPVHILYICLCPPRGGARSHGILLAQQFGVEHSSVHMYIHIRMHIPVCECVCVCVWERCVWVSVHVYIYIWMIVWHIYIFEFTSENRAAWGPWVKMWMYMYVNVRVTYIHVYTYLTILLREAHVHVHKCIRTYTCVHLCVFVCIYECACDVYSCLHIPQNLAAWGPCTYIYLHTFIYVCLCVYMHVRVKYINVRIRVFVCVHEFACDKYKCLYIPQNRTAWGPWFKMSMYMYMNVHVSIHA